MASISLKAIPKEVLAHILQEQLKLKIEKRVQQYSMEKTVYTIIREHKELKK